MTGFSRRGLLKAGSAVLLATGLAGCAIIGGRLRRYRIEEAPAPTALGASIEAEGIATPTEEHPLVVSISLTCQADEPRVYWSESGQFPFGIDASDNLAPTTPTATPPEAALDREGTPTSTPRPDSTPGFDRLVFTRRDGRARLLDGCWTFAPPDGSTSDSQRPRVTLAPGETYERDRVLLNDHRNRRCYPIGRYEFSDTFRTAPAGRPDEVSDPIEWGLSIEVSNLEPD